MKKVHYIILVSLIIVLWLGAGPTMAASQCPPPVAEWYPVSGFPNLHVGISLGTIEGEILMPKNSFDLNEILGVVISLDTDMEIVTSAGFVDRDFHLMLYFYDSECNLITADNPVELTDPPPPLLNNNQQTESIVYLPGDTPELPLKIGPFNAHTYYTLSQPGNYKVLARVFMREYSRPAEGEAEVGYREISKAIGFGAVESNTEEIELFVQWGTGRPAALKMEYTGESCEASSTSQDSSKWSCTDYGVLPPPNSTETVYITASNKSNPNHKKALKWLDNYPLNLNSSDDTFWIDARELPDYAKDYLSGETFIWIKNETGDVIFQTVIFHSSGSEPLNYGDQYGSLKLVGFVPAK